MQVAMLCEPDFVIVDNETESRKVLLDFASSRDVLDRTPMTPVSEYLPLELLQHHSKREIQIIELRIDFRYEIQSIFFDGVTGGTYVIVIQGEAVTVDLSVSASASTLSSALNSAASQIAPSMRECSNFGVAIKQYSSLNFRLDISFLVNNERDLSLLQVYDSSLEGKIFLSSLLILRLFNGRLLHL